LFNCFQLCLEQMNHKCNFKLVFVINLRNIQTHVYRSKAHPFLSKQILNFIYKQKVKVIKYPVKFNDVFTSRPLFLARATSLYEGLRPSVRSSVANFELCDWSMRFMQVILLSSHWLTILRPGWRQVAVQYCTNS
jgi:hypothetical protein